MTVCVPYYRNCVFTYVFLGVCRVLHEHIQRLSKVVTANHRALQIPEVTQGYVAWVLLVVARYTHLQVSSFSRKQNIINSKTQFAFDVILTVKFSEVLRLKSPGREWHLSVEMSGGGGGCTEGPEAPPPPAAVLPVDVCVCVSERDRNGEGPRGRENLSRLWTQGLISRP